MNFSMKKIVFASILVMSHSILGADIQLKKGWTKPNAWEKDIPETESNIKSVSLPKSENQLLYENAIQVFYKKILMMIFDRNFYSKNDNEILKRGILFKISESDLSLLENSLDPRDWDEIVTKVFKNIESTVFNSGHSNRALDNLNFYMNNSWSSYFKLNFFTILLFVLVPVLYLHIKHNYNLIAVGLLAIFLVGYVNEYKVCNSELGIEKVVSMLEENLHNPCEGFDIQGSDIKIAKRPWYDFWSKRSKKEECFEYLRKQSKKMDDSDWCSPDDVFLRYIYNIYEKQYDMLISKSIDGFKKLIEATPFPWNYFAGGLFVCLLATFATLFYKYVIATFITCIPSLKDDSQAKSNVPVSQNDIIHEKYHELLLLQNKTFNKLANAFQPGTNNGSSVQILEKEQDSEPIAALKKSVKEPNAAIENKTDINENEKVQSEIETPTTDI